MEQMTGRKKKYRGALHVELKVTPFDLEASGAVAAAVLESAQAPAVVIGRIAVWAWVQDPSQQEFTKDLDFAVRPEDIQQVAGALVPYQAEGASLSPLDIGGVAIVVPPGCVHIDFVHRRAEELGDLSGLFTSAIEAAIEEESTVTIGGNVFYLALLEHLVAMKASTGEDKDLRDAARLVAYSIREVDVDEVRDLLRRFSGPAAQGSFERVLRETGHPQAHRRGRYGKDQG